MDAETIELVLANRSYLYAIIARGFAEEADAAFLEALRSGHARDEVGLVDAKETSCLVAQFEGLRTEASSEGARRHLAGEYARTFVGPGRLGADPWETVHLSGRRTLFQPSVLDVRAAYREAGFVPVRLRQVSDDFIGLEFDFLAKLAARALDAWSGGDASAAARDLERSRTFLDEHVLTWVHSLATAIDADAGPCFYADFTRFAALVAQRDRGVVACLLETALS